MGLRDVSQIDGIEGERHNMSDLAYKISVMQAALEGKKIQVRMREDTSGAWGCECDCTDAIWNWNTFDYRIAPEPRKPREWLVWSHPNGTISVMAGQLICPMTQAIRVREVIEE